MSPEPALAFAAKRERGRRAGSCCPDCCFCDPGLLAESQLGGNMPAATGRLPPIPTLPGGSPTQQRDERLPRLSSLRPASAPGRHRPAHTLGRQEKPRAGGADARIRGIPGARRRTPSPREQAPARRRPLRRSRPRAGVSCDGARWLAERRSGRLVGRDEGAPSCARGRRDNHSVFGCIIRSSDATMQEEGRRFLGSRPRSWRDQRPFAPPLNQQEIWAHLLDGHARLQKPGGRTLGALPRGNDRSALVEPGLRCCSPLHGLSALTAAFASAAGKSSHVAAPLAYLGAECSWVWCCPASDFSAYPVESSAPPEDASGVWANGVGGGSVEELLVRFAGFDGYECGCRVLRSEA